MTAFCPKSKFFSVMICAVSAFDRTFTTSDTQSAWKSNGTPIELPVSDMHTLEGAPGSSHAYLLAVSFPASSWS